MAKRYNSLQVLRFIAAFTVLVLHSSFYTQERLANIPLYLNGANGVSLFFAISGFVMIISSQQLIGVSGSWKKFMLNRLVRIVPIYFLITGYKLLTMILAGTLVKHSVLSPVLIIKSFLFLPALNVDHQFRPLYGVGWTLNFEMFYYMLFCIALASKKNPFVFTSLILAPLAALAYFATPAWGDIRFYCNPVVLNFIYGMAAAKLVINYKKVPHWLAITLVAGGLLYLFTPGINYYGAGSIAVGIASMGIIYGAASADELISKYVPRVFVFLGGASYSLYLVHPSIAPGIPVVFTQMHIMHPFLSVVLSVCTATLAGVLFYKFVEKPLNAGLSNKLGRLRSKQPVQMTAGVLPEATCKPVIS